MMQHDAGVLEQIAVFDVPTIANAIEFFNVRAKTDGFMASSIRSIFGSRKTVLGYAATAKMSAALPPTDRQKALLTDHYHAVFQTPSPAIAVIQDIDERPIGSTTSQAVFDPTKRTEIRFLVEAICNRQAKSEHRRFNIIALISSAVYRESLNGRGNTISDTSNHRNAVEWRDGFVPVTEPGGSPTSDDESFSHGTCFAF